jgi:hypothetical protein
VIAPPVARSHHRIDSRSAVGLESNAKYEYLAPDYQRTPDGRQPDEDTHRKLLDFLLNDVKPRVAEIIGTQRQG